MIFRTAPLPGDFAYILAAHTRHYGTNFAYGLDFEVIVMQALTEFHATAINSRNRLWIMEDGGERKGSLVLQDRGTTAQLRLFYLAPELRGLGHGRALLEQFIDYARSAGFVSTYLWTSDEQPAAIHLYRRVGFRLTETNQANTFGRMVNEMCFRLQLN